jgi:hypothetical protein
LSLTTEEKEVPEGASVATIEMDLEKRHLPM